ncbi:translation initiation factor IF-2 N-terminal domain-containing protein [Virgibacillus sp. 179-BFC.A HS]|uniref:Translation initiation factor IF-2 N-terminal domain-containing protein n=1 Tax=Tigheibacillus jepli TaxID=3035914 RepID=A0ABU5CHP6_9BACI|nr:translation initiation factor IF-2 N-terminal domain-containing protein [Virgibacillus sp. 179-BFC.A HS]MDY0405843.1 translation initiation factor IF-2 N-terminal domain-containing protein [Virgibacillus sp. 179-BFC.A HS]
MRKMRVYEYAKQNNTTSKAVIEKLKEMDYEVSNHMSTITENAKNRLDGVFRQVKEKKQTDGTNQNRKPARNQPNKSANRPAKKFSQVMADIMGITVIKMAVVSQITV